MSSSLYDESSCFTLHQPRCCLLTPSDLEHQLAELLLVLLIAQKEFEVLGPPCSCTLHYKLLREATPQPFLSLDGVMLVRVSGKVGTATRKPQDFKLFLNKKQLCQLMLKVEVTEIHALCSNQEETDSRVVLYLHHAVKLGFKPAIVRTPDTDIFVILLHHAHTISLTVYIDIGTGKHRQLINVTELATSLGQPYCSTLLAFMSSLERTAPVLLRAKASQLGEEWKVKPEVQEQLEGFTCLMYGQSRLKSVNLARTKILKKMVGEDETLSCKSRVDFACLPPCQNALIPYIHLHIMASTEPQPRFGQSVKGLLSDKVSACSGDVIALTRQVLKGSRSQELLGMAARNMVIQEDAILHSEDSLRKMSIITTHLQYQQEAIQKNVEHSRNLQDQLRHVLK
ncbi:hypothetical protein GJAV_G00238790 [Gymnothorax javanicus]|nr:hypothetical protein GJAV_G00238790 [Gymnothorax javanicus]